ncbi:MAG: EF-hand domain-containing protein [Sphingomonas sp.]
MPIASLLIVLAATAGQAPAAAPVTPVPVAGGRHWRRMFVSPMGEPFRPTSRDDDALGDWFRQADRNHDGQLTLEEMQQDAARFFGTLDANHDGEIDPDEITRYEQVIAPEISSGPHLALSSLDSGDGGRHRHHGGWGRSDDNESHQGAARYGLLDLPEPVVSADSDFNRGVSLAEFHGAATQRFVALDIDHHGYLDLAGLESIRPAPAPEANKPHSSPDDAGLAPPPEQ